MENVVLVVLVVGMGLAWWWLSRRRRDLLDGSSLPGDTEEPGPPEVFTRDALVTRPRGYDPGAWDDTADGPSSATPDPAPSDDQPTHVDREYLQRRQRAARPSEPPAAPAAPTPAEDEDLPAYFDREYLQRRARRPTSEPTDPEA